MTSATRSALLAVLASAALAACGHTLSAKAQKTAEIHHDLGLEALQKGQAQDALREFDTALQSDPDMPEAHLGRGLVLEYAFSKLKDAEAEYRKALAVRPAYPEAHNNLGQLLARTGRPEEALASFDEALANTFYREPWVARCNKGQALHRMGRRDEGLTELRACLGIAPRYCAGHRELGRILLGDGKVKEALDELGAYVRHCEQVVDAHQQLGLARMKAGDLPGARASFERCLELAKGTPAGDGCQQSLELLR
ncbi:MAG: tetratricopeptide repeat protein [Anaeromyxobacter sp.]|nr:tetratricopeptide repeat protein [Anaeromyxobacter sp.]MBL0276120.1 tetratricopeptide repeat protein [Anaeromyxobacter sp.]